MRVNLEWLREYVDFDADAEGLAERLTMAGLEVDAVLPAAPTLDGVVVAHVTALRPHPNAERLSVATVDAGGAAVEVVCGAPNVATGIAVPYAPIGTALPGGQKIKKAKLRGVESNGMLCSAKELELADDAAGLMVLDADAPAGVPLRDYLKLDDAVIDIDLTPNRGDCFSIVGVAREIAAGQGVPLEPAPLAPLAVRSDAAFPVELEAGRACPRFAGRVIRNLRAGGRSPDWMRERLRRAGLRPIHPVVDVTNYVMLEYGQPLHAYDLSKLSKKISVRMAQAGEALTLLDGKEIALDDDVLVIADASGAIGLAGIMGGASTAVDEATQDIFLESAFFSPDAILGRARRYGLHTDASVRFERGVDPTEQARAVERAARLLCEISGGEPGPLQLTESAADLPVTPAVTLTHRRVQSLLGVELDTGDVETLLDRLDMQIESHGESWTVRPPAYRFDIAIEEDLIEELGRMIGYDNIPATVGTGSMHLGEASEETLDQDVLTDVLVARGFAEVITYSFIDEDLQRLIHPDTDPIRLANPMSSDMNVMRRSLWPGLLLVAQRNLSRQQSRLRIFETGPQFLGEATGEIREINMLAGLATGSQWPEHWDCERRDVDFFDLKGDLKALLGKTGRAEAFRFEAGQHPALQPGQSTRISLAGDTVGWLGRLHPNAQHQLDLKQSILLFALNLDRILAARVPAYRARSKYPRVRRDIAVLVDEGVPVADLIEHTESAAGELLQSVEIFDLYRGGNVDSKQKSVGLGLILQSASRTLTDEDADRTVRSVTQCLERELGATIRT